MEFLTWTGTAGNALLPIMQLAVVALALALVAKLIFVLAGLDGPRFPGPDGTTTARTPGDLASLATRYSFFAALAAFICTLAAGAVMPSPVEAGILGVDGRALLAGLAVSGSHLHSVDPLSPPPWSLRQAL